MPARSLLVSLLVALTLLQPGLCQRPRIPIPAGFGPTGAPPANAVRIIVTNQDELRDLLPDHDFPKDFMREVDSDLWMEQSNHDLPGPEDYISQLIRLGAPDSVVRFGFQGSNGKYVYTLAPVEDFNEFVGSIDYGVVIGESTAERLIKVEVATEEITQENLLARAQEKGPDAVERLRELLDGKESHRRRSDDDPARTDQLGSNFSAGDYVAATIAGEPINGRVLGSKTVHIDEALFQIEVLKKDSLQGLTNDRQLKRRLKAVERVTFWLPPSRLRKLRSAPTPLQKQRTWSDASGDFSVEATYVKLDGERVVLQLASGKEVRVPLNKLSDVDRGLVADLTRADANPFAPDAPPSQSLGADWREAKTIRVRKSSRWRWTPPGLSPPKAIDSPHARFDLDTRRGQSPGGTSLESLYLSADGGTGIAVMNVGHMDTKTQLQRFDVGSGQLESLVECPLNSLVLDAIPQEGLVLLSTSDNNDDDSRVFLRSLAGGTLEPICDFDTQGPDEERDNLIGARLLDASRLVTWNQSDRLTVWDHTKGSALHTMELDGRSDSPLITGPERRFVFAGGDEAIAVIDSQTGQLVAAVPHGLGSIDSLSVDKGMKRLALTADDKVFVIDLSNGKVLSALLGLPGKGDIDFIGKFLLYDGRYLVAPEYPIFLWQYVMADGADYDCHASIRGRRMWYATREGEGRQAAWSIASIALPHQAIRDRMKELGDLDKMILLTKGDSLTIETDTDLDAATTERLLTTIGQAFEKAGFKVIPASKANAETKQAVITCKKADKPIEVRVSKYVAGSPANAPTGFTPPPGFAIPRFVPLGNSKWVEETHTVTPYHSAITIRHQGETLWADVDLARDGARFPNFRGDPVQTVLKRITEPNVPRLLATELPGQICRKGPVGGTFGASLLSADGIVEDYLGEEDE